MPHYYSSKQTSNLRLLETTQNLRGNEIRLKTASGVFAKKGVDRGSKLLIEKCVIEKGDKVLDLGCGVGVVGIAIKKAYPECEVWQSDVNRRAVLITRKNDTINHTENVVIISDGFKKIKESFNTILLNPPQSAGKDVCFMLIEESKEHLVKGGSLQLVIRTQKGGRQIAKYMEDTFGNVETIAKGSGYRILVSENE